MKTSTKIWIGIFIVSLVGGIATSRFLFSAINILPSGIVFNMTPLAWVAVAFNLVNILSGNILFFRFLKNRKLNTVLFFTTVPLGLVFGGIVYVISGIDNYSGQTFGIVRTALNISQNNNNKYLWIGVFSIVYVAIMFLTFTFVTRPVKKIERATKRLSYGEVSDKIDIGGNKQFLEIENSLNKINQNYKRKEVEIGQTNFTQAKYIPKQFVKFLGKKNIIDLQNLQQVKKVVTILYCNIRNMEFVEKSLSLEQNFNFTNSYLTIVNPVIKKNGGFVDKYLEDGVLAVFINSKNAIKCAIDIVKAVNTKNLQKSEMPELQVGIALHTGEVIFESCEDSEKSFAIVSNCFQTCSRLDEINKTFGTTLVFTKETLNNLPSSFKFSYRYIGNTKVDNEFMSVFECLDVYSKPKKDKLIKNRNFFENGVRSFMNTRFNEAKNIFEKVYRDEKDDKICYAYYNKCCESLGRKPLNPS